MSLRSLYSLQVFHSLGSEGEGTDFSNEVADDAFIDAFLLADVSTKELDWNQHPLSLREPLRNMPLLYTCHNILLGGLSAVGEVGALAQYALGPEKG